MVKNLQFTIFLMFISINLFSDILFSSNIEYYEKQLYIADDSGNEIKLISDPKSELDYSNPYYLEKSKIVFTRTYSSENGYSITTIDIFNRIMNKILFNTNSLLKDLKYFDYPVVNNNGTILYLIYGELGNDNTHNIYEYDLKSNNMKKITEIGYCDDLAISNDNKFLSFIKNNQIYVMTISTEQYYQITNDDYMKTNPVFNYENNKIIYVGFNNYKAYINLINLQNNQKESIEIKKDFYYKCSMFNKPETILVSRGEIGNINISSINLNNKKEKILIKNYGYSTYFTYIPNKNDNNLSYLTPTIPNLRFRETPELNGKLIRLLTQGEKLELLEKGKHETINGATGTWVKVKTDKGEIGWAFDAYLEEMK